jgi:two-component system sensor kinase FixL
MSELMSELADVVRGDMTLKTESHLDDVVSEAVTSTVSSFEEEDVQVAHYSTSAVPPVLLNQKQIQQVISNLVRNAIEAPRLRKQLKLAITMRVPDANSIEVSIADDANGIPDSEHHRVFSRFVSSKKGGVRNRSCPLSRYCRSSWGKNLVREHPWRGHNIFLHFAPRRLKAYS